MYVSLLYQMVFIPKGRYSEFFFYSESHYSEWSFSERLLFQKVIILVVTLGHYSKIWNIKTQPFGITTFQNNNLLE